MIGKFIERERGAPTSIRHLNDYITGKKNTEDKVLFAGTFNIVGGLPKATKQMECVAAMNKRVEYPVVHCLLSWRAGEQPTIAQTEEAVQIALEELGLSNQQCVWALHQDTDNVHVHISASRIDLLSYKAITPAGGWTINAMERAARRVEFAQGWEVEANSRYVADKNGNIHEKRKLSKELAEQPIPQNVRSKENETGEKSAIRIAQEKLKGFTPKSWDDLHSHLADLGMRYEKKGSGAVFFVGDEAVKASAVSKRFTLSKLEASLGEYAASTHTIDVKQIAPEPLSHANDTDDWREYQKFRSTFYADKRAARAELKEQIDDERNSLKKKQADEREAHIDSKSWRGKSRELNTIRSLFAAKHKGEKLRLKEKHAAMREAFNKQYAKLPSYEEWLRYKGKESEADEYRFRTSDAPALVFTPDSLSATDNKVKDIRGFEAKADKSGVRFIDRDSGVLAFHDAGRKISLYATDDAAILGSLQLGMQKWESVYLTGSDEYKARCVELAVEHGIKMTNPELRDAIDRQRQQKRIADIEEKMIRHSRASAKTEQFAQYHEAVGASRYRVSATQIREDGSKRGFMVNKADGAPDGFSASEVVGKMKRLIALQDGGRNIYLTPISEDKHHILIDDLDHEDLAKFLADGYQPAAIIETSPNNFQAIITISKLGTDHDHEIANRIVRDLNTKYGDPKLSGEVHAHRAPGFENRKPKHKRNDGTYPETKLVKSERVECPKTAELARSLLEALQRQEADRQKRLDDVLAALPSDKSCLDVMKAYEMHFKDILRIQHDDKKHDLSRLDSMTAVRLRATGHSKEEVREAIELLAPRMREALGKPSDTHRWADYSARTAGYAFGKGGERSIEKLSSYVEHWKKLEDEMLSKLKAERTKPPKIETAQTEPPKPERRSLADITAWSDKELADEYQLRFAEWREKVTALASKRRAKLEARRDEQDRALTADLDRAKEELNSFETAIAQQSELRKGLRSFGKKLAEYTFMDKLAGADLTTDAEMSDYLAAEQSYAEDAVAANLKHWNTLIADCDVVAVYISASDNSRADEMRQLAAERERRNEPHVRGAMTYRPGQQDISAIKSIDEAEAEIKTADEQIARNDAELRRMRDALTQWGATCDEAAWSIARYDGSLDALDEKFAPDRKELQARREANSMKRPSLFLKQETIDAEAAKIEADAQALEAQYVKEREPILAGARKKFVAARSDNAVVAEYYASRMSFAQSEIDKAKSAKKILSAKRDALVKERDAREKQLAQIESDLKLIARNSHEGTKEWRAELDAANRLYNEAVKATNDDAARDEAVIDLIRPVIFTVNKHKQALDKLTEAEKQKKRERDSGWER